MLAKLKQILQHFSIDTPLNFINPNSAPEVIIPKKPPTFIPLTQTEQLPSREFFIAAAKRAMELGDTVSSK